MEIFLKNIKNKGLIIPVSRVCGRIIKKIEGVE